VAFPRRLTLLVCGVAALLSVVWFRLFSLQVLQRDRWLAAAHAMRHPGTRVDATRGPILDARGRVLVRDDAAIGLAFVPADWERRTRWRCGECGAVQTRRPADRRPASCSCRARGDRLEALPDEDVGPLEDGLGVPRGTLARHAAARIAALEARIDRLARRTVERLDLDEFREADVRRSLRSDHFRREQPLRERDVGEGWRDGMADLSPAALRLLELDATARYRGYVARASVTRRPVHRGLLGQCIGRTALPTAEDVERLGKRVSPSTLLGRTGIEGCYDDWLRGIPGLRYAASDDDEDEAVPEGTAPQPGAPLVLSLVLEACIEAQRVIDEVATPEGYAAHGPPSGGIVALESRTGRIVAWGEAPRFDPTGALVAPMSRDEAEALVGREPGDALPEVSVFEASEDPPNPELSRVAQVAVEPGSSFKILAALFALGSDLPPAGVLTCTGKAHSDADRPGCHHAHGPVGAEEALCVSCNRWFAWSLGGTRERIAAFREPFPAFARSLGIHRRTGVDFAREGYGLFRPEREYSYRHMAIGQGKVLVTPLQMARVAAAVANGGHLVTPRLALRVGDREIPVESTHAGLSPRAIEVVRRGLAAAVERDGGTGRSAFWETPPPPGVRVYGKTGTAQTSKGGDFDPDAIGAVWHHWFVGFAERGSESISFAVVLHARTEAAGGLTAAKAAARFVRWWFDREAAR
jgi:cell division protein FtsI/penicillin-binding protein 2